jgi:Family of unknown function (DUF5685)
MFGLMRRAPRLPYCGTCKTIGARYGQRARMLLNHDLVFLGELLMHYSQEPEWSPAYRSYNCFAKPKEIYPILDYTASITVILAHYRIADHVVDLRPDSRRWPWRAVARMLSPQFRSASSKLREFGFPMDELDSILSTQRAREANPKSLADVAEPTATATAFAFAHGGASKASFEDLYRIGHRFGYLIYVLDAFEDRAKDARSGAFNALARFPEIDGRAEILKVVDEIELPESFKARLRTNVEERLGMRPRVLCCTTRKTFRERCRDAAAFARRMREREGIGLAAFAAAVVVALIFPHHAKGSMSSRECLTVPFSLMALGTIVPGPADKPGCLSRCGDCCGSCACDGCCDCCECGACCDC